MALVDLAPHRAIMYLSGIQSYDNASGERVTPIGGRLATIGGVTEAYMGSDGTVSSEYPSIIKPRGFEFDGSDLITVPDNDLLTFADDSGDKPFSVSLLASFEDAATTRSIITKATGVTAGEYSIYRNTSGAIVFLLTDNDASAYIFVRVTLADGAPENKIPTVLTFTYDGSAVVGGMKIYLDGSEAVIGTGSSGVYTRMRNTSTELRLGSGVSSLFKGKMPVPPIIYDRELSVSEVAELTAIMRHQYAITP